MRDRVADRAIRLAVGPGSALDHERAQRQPVNVERHLGGNGRGLGRPARLEAVRAAGRRTRARPGRVSVRPLRSYAASSTPERRKPVSISRVSRRPRRNRPATSSTISASATSAAMSALRSRLRDAPRLAARNACCAPIRDSCTAGTRPTSDAAGQREQHRHAQAHAVDVGLKTDRKRPDERHRADGVGAPHRERDAQRSTGQRQQHVLAQQRRDDAQASGAERDAHPDLALPRAGARQHQVGGVGADRQQDEQHDGLQPRQRSGDHLLGPARRLPERQHLRGHGGVGRGMDRARAPAPRRRRSACAWAGVTPGASLPITA